MVQYVLKRVNIAGRIAFEPPADFWGYDVEHDWPWWKKQIRYFLPYLL